MNELSNLLLSNKKTIGLISLNKTKKKKNEMKKKLSTENYIIEKMID